MSRKNARFAAVVIGVILIVGIINFIKDILSGMTFDELRSNILLLIFGAIIEYAMIIIATSKDDPAEEAEKEEQEETSFNELEEKYETEDEIIEPEDMFDEDTEIIEPEYDIEMTDSENKQKE